MSATATQPIEVWKCEKCGRVLMEHSLRSGLIIKTCERCKHKNVLYR